MRSKDVLYKFFTTLHRAVFFRSKGRVFGRAMGMPVVGLVTVGRKTGRRRATMLTAPIADDERIVLVASFGGDDRHPAWYRNLRANPDVEVLLRGRSRSLVARTATDGERAALWADIIRIHTGYERYQRRTDRLIPVVVLEPRT
ncbi:nitroreductase/quinone reductase family protein [Kribbella sp.]|uniref:nitroreductase/quinone reductase family protein n=1 Tax=Kribbella sp. TaxID=1871183 RepID=UPI002D39DA31|nr:nitroreductase/quinone reductase family protein [Kribbella sp.]HZX02801.1 nitroreductase/quinone reductase family protein [Kribbella sp.]